VPSVFGPKIMIRFLPATVIAISLFLRFAEIGLAQRRWLSGVT
jgi:hypothetical protein